MRNIFLLSLVGVFILSCGTQKGIVTNYLENSTDSTGTNLVKLAEPLIQKNDLLSVKVYSLASKPEIDALYNLPEQTVAGSSTTTTTAGFLVDNEGNIEFPRIGTLHVEGLKKAELAQQLKTTLDTILKNPTVIVRFLNFKVTVLGEVRGPGTFNVPTERITILEALGLAGDITEFGNKATVKIMRENSNQASIQTVDLTSKSLFASPLYRLQQNDVVFVEQTNRRIRQQEQQNFAQQLGFVTGIVTAVALLLNFIR